MSEGWQHAPEKGHMLLMQFVIWVALKLGRPIVSAILLPIVFYYMLFAREARLHSREFLSRIFKRKATWREIFKHFYTFALVATDRVHFLAGHLKPFDIEIEGEDILKKYGSQGALLVTSHVGSFEVMRVIAHQDPSAKLRILLDVKHNNTLMSLLNKLHPELASNIIDADAFGPNLALTLNDAIKNSEIVGIMGDRLRGTDSGLQFSFLGDEAIFPAQLWYLASIIQAPVIHCIGIYLGNNRYKIQFSLVTDDLSAPRKLRPSKIQQVAQIYVSQLEAVVRQHPYNWFNFYGFWQTKPNPSLRNMGLEQ